MQEKLNLVPQMHLENNFVKEINGVTFVDAVALEQSINDSLPVKYHLRQKMIHAGVTFWNLEQTIVKKPVIGISSIGGFSVCLAGDLPPGTLKLRFGDTQLGPISINSIVEALRTTMGMQSSHTYMNPFAKSPTELYEKTVEHAHLSLAHAATLGFTCLGLSKKAELEFDVQRDIIHLARETSARSTCQDEPTLVALTEEGAKISAEILKSTLAILQNFKKTKEVLDWREERNALFPLSATISLGINGSLKNYIKLISAMNDAGKEIEFRNALALMNDSLSALFPELFQPTKNFGHSYPESWQTTRTSLSNLGFFTVAKSQLPKTKEAILLLGAPGVGKSTQTEHITLKKTEAMCISTGNLVRRLQAKIVQGTQMLTPTELWASKSLDEMKRGRLMDDDAVYALLMEYLSPGGEGYDAYTKAKIIILDGVIKAERNILPFEQALQRFNQNKAHTPMQFAKVINLSAKPEELIARQQERVKKTETLGLTQRPDDALGIYQQRLKDYHSSIEQVCHYYRSHYTFIDIDTSMGIEQTTSSLLSAIESVDDLANHPTFN